MRASLLVRRSQSAPPRLCGAQFSLKRNPLTREMRMLSEGNYGKVLGVLREALAGFKPGQKTYDEIVAPREQVFARYKPIFSCDHVASLSKEEFTSFLYFKNNRHWSGLYRKGLGAAADMGKLRLALAVLLDEGKPIRE